MTTNLSQHTKDYMREYWRKPENKLRRNKMNRVLQRAKYTQLRQEIFKILGNKCIRCGFSDIRALQLDHINGDGYIERKKYSHVTMLKIWIKDPYIKEKIQVLCSNCNWIKKSENNENIPRKI